MAFIGIVVSISAFASLSGGLTVISAYAVDASACPHPGQCTCNAASGVMTDHAMESPYNRINNGCIEEGWF